MSEDQFGNSVQSQDELGTGLKVVSFCLPIVGAILYFVYKKEYPNKSKQACTAALIGFGVGIVLQVIMYATGMAGSY
ncbi:MAG: hypothetical protein ACSHWW_00335 [Nonlabens sp.]|uniref:hypothetical protein n=1 Tax=Nonlabens sp. TaxID=1888209 RepID=UPI003EF92494